MSLADTAESWLAAHHADLVEWRRACAERVTFALGLK